jgi:hypothetical protein
MKSMCFNVCFYNGTSGAMSRIQRKFLRNCWGGLLGAPASWREEFHASQRDTRETEDHSLGQIGRVAVITIIVSVIVR